MKRLNEWNAIKEAEFKLNLKLIESDPFKSELEKAREMLPLMAQRREDLKKELDIVTEQNKSARTEDQKITTKKEMIKLQGQLNDLEEKSVRARGLTSFSSQMRLLMVEMKNSWGTWATQAVAAIKHISDAISGSLTNNITGLIMGTKSWGEALRDIGSTIMTAIVQSIVQMGVQWLMTHVIMRGAMAATHAIGVALGWSGVAETNAQEAAKAPALAANAASASVGSFGASAIIGMVLAIGAIGAIIAAASAREAGGGVIAGRPYIVGEKRPELFVPTSHGIILPQVPALAQAGQKSSAVERGGSTVNQNLHMHFDKRKMVNAMKGDMKAIALDVFATERVRMGFQT